MKPQMSKQNSPLSVKESPKQREKITPKTKDEGGTFEIEERKCGDDFILNSNSKQKSSVSKNLFEQSETLAFNSIGGEQMSEYLKPIVQQFSINSQQQQQKAPPDTPFTKFCREELPQLGGKNLASPMPMKITFEDHGEINSHKRSSNHKFLQFMTPSPSKFQFKHPDDAHIPCDNIFRQLEFPSSSTSRFNAGESQGNHQHSNPIAAFQQGKKSHMNMIGEALDQEERENSNSKNKNSNRNRESSQEDSMVNEDDLLLQKDLQKLQVKNNFSEHIAHNNNSNPLPTNNNSNSTTIKNNKDFSHSKTPNRTATKKQQHFFDPFRTQRKHPRDLFQNLKQKQMMQQSLQMNSGSTQNTGIRNTNTRPSSSTPSSAALQFTTQKNLFGTPYDYGNASNFHKSSMTPVSAHTAPSSSYKKYSHDAEELAQSEVSNMGDAPKQSTAKKQKIVCNCKKSRCLKLYCECFQAKQYCHDCNCSNCANVKENEDERKQAMVSLLERNPHAFDRKVPDEETTEVNRTKKAATANDRIA